MSEAITVLLHGFTGAPETWDDVTAAIDGRVVRPRLPGHGPHPRALGDWTAEVGALAAWLEREGVRRAHLVGYSLGGRLAGHLLERDDLFGRATLIGAHPGLTSDAARDDRRRSDAAWIERLERDGLDAFLDAWEALPLWETQRRLPRAILARQWDLRRTHTAAGLADALRRLGLAEMPPAPRARVPMHRVVGALDASHRELARALGDPLTEVPGVGHNVVLEAPGALAELLR